MDGWLSLGGAIYRAPTVLIKTKQNTHILWWYHKLHLKYQILHLMKQIHHPKCLKHQIHHTDKKKYGQNTKYANPKHSWSPNSTYLHLDFYLLSWRWWPLWSGGILFQWPVLQQKAREVHFLFKISVSCAKRLSRSKKWRLKTYGNLQKTCLF